MADLLKRKKIFYNGSDKFKKRVAEILNDDDEINRINQLEATVKELMDIVYGIEKWEDDTGDFIVDSDGDSLVFISKTQTNEE